MPPERARPSDAFRLGCGSASIGDATRPPRGCSPRYAQDLAAAVVGTRKAILTRDGVRQYDLATDPEETAPAEGTVAEFVAACRRAGLPRAAVDAAASHLGRGERVGAAA